MAMVSTRTSLTSADAAVTTIQPRTTSQQKSPDRTTMVNEGNGSAKHRISFVDDSDPNPKRRKTDEVNEALLRIPLSRG